MVKRLSQADRPLIVTGLLMLTALAVSLVGLAIDPRVVAGAPAWLKPAKFAASIALYALTLAWIFTLLPEWVRTRRIVGWTTAIAMVLELVIIDLQAWRGTTSHFNVSTPFNVALFAIMGVAIVVQTVTSIAVAVAVCRQRFADRALGWALRLGMIITILGAFSGGLMVRPTQTQLAAAHAGQPMTIAGAHTIGGLDGGAGLPGTGWSTAHGDLRVSHFVGLHALQALPLFAWLLSRKRLSEAVHVRLTLIAGVSYFALFAILMWQALRGQSILVPDTATITALVGWAALTVAAAATSAARQSSVHAAVSSAR